MERIYHYFWKHRISRGEPLPLCGGGKMCVIDPGIHNLDSGPDFTAAKLMIDGCKWVGNVEIHVKASDWVRHGHDADKAYDSIILHAVGIDDYRVKRKDGTGVEVPQYMIPVPKDAFAAFAFLSDSNISDVRCRTHIKSFPRLLLTDWMQSLGVARLQEKSDRVARLVKESAGDWQQACFITFARALGFGLNALPFEMLAKTLSLNFLARHSDSILQLEALLFGQAGLLEMSDNIFDEYYQQLCREYYFLSKKYGLRPIQRNLWKYARTRPQNFPHKRIALLAASCRGGFNLFSRLIATDRVPDTAELREIFSWRLSDYWLEHSSFVSENGGKVGALSASSLDLLVINVIAPLLYAYGSIHGDDSKTDMAVELLESLPPERNSVISSWKSYGLTPRDAFESQGLLYLHRSYCQASKCLYCRLGHQLLRRTLISEGRSLP